MVRRTPKAWKKNKNLLYNETNNTYDTGYIQRRKFYENWTR